MRVELLSLWVIMCNKHLLPNSKCRMLLGIVFVVFIFISSCKKEQLNTTSGISFSTDTLTFDTLFSTIGSTTRFFTLRNTTKQPIKISNIRLAGGSSSRYRINVDGDSGVLFKNIEIPAKDSLYVFVEVTVNPTAANLPFLVEDSIQFVTNGHLQQVQLNAYGQNAHFFNGDSIETNTIWNDDLPYIILNYLQIKSSATLTINKGCKVYFGSGAALLVEGSLNIVGTDTANMVTFRGVRLDKDIAGRSYDDFPGQYSGVFFLRGSIGNIEYLSMRNSLYGINVGNIKTSDDPNQNMHALQAMSITNAPNVSIKNSKIYNHAFYGLFGFLGKIYAENTLVYNCGKNVIGLYDGGQYEFQSCTFYARSSTYISHAKDPMCYFNDYFKINDNTYLFADAAAALFENCIVYGTLENEIVIDDNTSNTLVIDTKFDHCVLKAKPPFSPSVFVNYKLDDPQFIDLYKNNFGLKSTSPCRDYSTAFFPTKDIEGFFRTGAVTDCGAYIYR